MYQLVIKKCFPYLKASYLNLPYMFAHSCFKSFRHCCLLFVLSYHLHLLANLFFAVPGCWWNLVVYFILSSRAVWYIFLWCCMPSAKLFYYLSFRFSGQCLCKLVMLAIVASLGVFDTVVELVRAGHTQRVTEVGLTGDVHAPSTTIRQSCTKIMWFLREKLANFSAEYRNCTFYKTLYKKFCPTAKRLFSIRGYHETFWNNGKTNASHCLSAHRNQYQLTIHCC